MNNFDSYWKRWISVSLWIFAIIVALIYTVLFVFTPLSQEIGLGTTFSWFPITLIVSMLGITIGNYYEKHPSVREFPLPNPNWQSEDTPKARVVLAVSKQMGAMYGAIIALSLYTVLFTYPQAINKTWQYDLEFCSDSHNWKDLVAPNEHPPKSMLECMNLTKEERRRDTASQH